MKFFAMFGARVTSIMTASNTRQHITSITYHQLYGAIDLPKDEHDFTQERLRKPLRLEDLGRISIRQAVGGEHFTKNADHLPLPTMLKSFLHAVFTDQLTFRVFVSRWL